MTNIGALISRQLKFKFYLGHARPQLVSSLDDLDRKRLSKTAQNECPARTVMKSTTTIASPALSRPSTQSLDSTLAAQPGLAFRNTDSFRSYT